MTAVKCAVLGLKIRPSLADAGTYHTNPTHRPLIELEKWLRLVGQLRAFLKWCLACAAYAAVSRAGRLLKYP